MDPINKNWTDEQGYHQGGVSTGIGFTIAWQRGPLNESGRNGAFMLEVLNSCLSQMRYYQDSKFACPENEQAISHIEQAICALESRRKSRQDIGKLGTHKV